MEREDPDRGSRPQLPRPAARLEGCVRGRPRRARRVASIHRRVPPPAVALGNGQLSNRVPPAHPAGPKRHPHCGQVPGGRPPARLQRRAPDAAPACLLPGSLAGPRGRPPAADPGRLRDRRHHGRGRAVGRIHRRPDPSRPQMVVGASSLAVPGRRRRHVAEHAVGAVQGPAPGRGVRAHSEAPNRPARRGMARPGLRARWRPTRADRRRGRVGFAGARPDRGGPGAASDRRLRLDVRPRVPGGGRPQRGGPARGADPAPAW